MRTRKKHTGHKRNVGIGTALGAVVTGGASLLAVPAYCKRCIIWGLTVDQAMELNVTREQEAGAQADATLSNQILIFGLLLFWSSSSSSLWSRVNAPLSPLRWRSR